MVPKTFMRYEPFLIAYEGLQMHAHFLAAFKSPTQPRSIALTAPYPHPALHGPQAVRTPSSLISQRAKKYGPTKLVALGTVVHARSGDNGSKANVGLWVRHSDEHA